MKTNVQHLCIAVILCIFTACLAHNSQNLVELADQKVDQSENTNQSINIPDFKTPIIGPSFIDEKKVNGGSITTINTPPLKDFTPQDGGSITVINTPREFQDEPLQFRKGSILYLSDSTKSDNLKIITLNNDIESFIQYNAAHIVDFSTGPNGKVFLQFDHEITIDEDKDCKSFYVVNNQHSICLSEKQLTDINDIQWNAEGTPYFRVATRILKFNRISKNAMTSLEILHQAEKPILKWNFTDEGLLVVMTESSLRIIDKKKNSIIINQGLASFNYVGFDILDSNELVYTYQTGNRTYQSVSYDFNTHQQSVLSQTNLYSQFKKTTSGILVAEAENGLVYFEPKTSRLLNQKAQSLIVLKTIHAFTIKHNTLFVSGLDHNNTPLFASFELRKKIIISKDIPNIQLRDVKQPTFRGRNYSLSIVQKNLMQFDNTEILDFVIDKNDIITAWGTTLDSTTHPPYFLQRFSIKNIDDEIDLMVKLGVCRRT